MTIKIKMHCDDKDDSRIDDQSGNFETNLFNEINSFSVSIFRHSRWILLNQLMMMLDGHRDYPSQNKSKLQLKKPLTNQALFTMRKQDCIMTATLSSIIIQRLASITMDSQGHGIVMMKPYLNMQ